MDNGPLVSVGIPCYNRPEGLRRTLECICGQTYRNLEIIISDNCSPDPDVERVAREFACKDSRIQYYRQSVNEGPAFNFKFVLEKATGEYFMWAADDDEWDSSFVYKLLNFLVHNLDVSVVMSNIKKIDDGGNNFDVIRYDPVLKSNYNQFRLAIFAAGHAEITYYMYGLFRTSAIKKIFEKFDNSFGRDMMCMCELLLFSKLGHVNEFLFNNHVHLKGTAERYSDEEIGKYYGDPFNYLRLFLNFGPYLINSPNISLKCKLWVPFMVIRQSMWISKVYAGRLFYIIFRKNLGHFLR